jgi:hypothetical protein
MACTRRASDVAGKYNDRFGGWQADSGDDAGNHSVCRHDGVK